MNFCWYDIVTTIRNWSVLYGTLTGDKYDGLSQFNFTAAHGFVAAGTDTSHGHGLVHQRRHNLAAP
ncbi:MAG: hypothetical protein L0H97_07695 [Lactococcus sp.]|nr:hypothetical protein [Lactococcus sp.]MDN5983803.1 hypothetical protein [Lactococcus sp.]MDN6013611.1 hypothetical protein [Lactococcus sp.]